MSDFPEGTALVYCEGAYNTSNGKTAHGLVRRTRRYQVASVIDSTLTGRDAGEIIDGRSAGIPIVRDLNSAVEHAKGQGRPATHLVIGLAPDGGRLGASAREAVKGAIRLGLNVDSGLHDFLSEDREISAFAENHGVQLRDVRKPPPRSELHFFSGKIGEVRCPKIAVLGTDSAIGKRTTAWLLVDALNAAGCPTEMIGTGQTAWMQGARYALVLDSLVNDFVSGEIEHAVWSAWNETSPRAIVIEGQGSLMNPAYPGGYEILAAGRPDVIVMQHAPTRREYDGFPGYPLHPLQKQIKVTELISDTPVLAVTINHEGLERDEVPAACETITRETGLPAIDVLLDGASELARVVEPHLGTVSLES